MELYCQNNGLLIQYVRQKWETMPIKVSFNKIFRYNNHLDHGIVE